MKLSEIKAHLSQLKQIEFRLPNGTLVPEHFHVTEVGKITRDFIDCGGTVRHEEVINFQLWEADDYNHRLHPDKLLKIIELSQQKLSIPDLQIEIEYQGDTIEKFNLDFNGTSFLLIPMQTDCLAKDNCGIPNQKQRVRLSELQAMNACCDPKSGCC